MNPRPKRLSQIQCVTRALSALAPVLETFACRPCTKVRALCNYRRQRKRGTTERDKKKIYSGLQAVLLLTLRFHLSSLSHRILDIVESLGSERFRGSTSNSCRHRSQDARLRRPSADFSSLHSSSTFNPSIAGRALLLHRQSQRLRNARTLFSVHRTADRRQSQQDRIESTTVS